ncbi:MAG: NAD(P)-binding protein [Legionellaceae bacterium]|nr:NAD(P)-binding protein [Legionellaceae bacterium]MBP9775816.1 NAD(P)-binding protein [Legionellaceae bacterium]
MLGKKVIVIGGSIAGCTSAILLSRLGADVTILERSGGRSGLGSGISLPETIVRQCIEHDLFDADIPQLKLNGRSFIRKKEQGETDQETFWTQALRVIAFNWADVYQNLRSRIDSESYHTNTTVIGIEPNEHGYQIKTSTGKMYAADLIIAADGVDSNTRAGLLPDVHPIYAGYIAWRGLLDEQSLVEESIFDEHTPYYVFPNGHLLLYRVPGPNYRRTGQIILSWTLYENRQGQSLSDLLIDNQGKQHTRSLPAGSLTEQHVQHLHAIAKDVLPESVLKYIFHTRQPFIHAIFDCHTPSYPHNHIIFVGDAAGTLRPHSGSGVFRALANGLSFAKLIESNPEKELSDYVTMWKNSQSQLFSDEIPKATRMGEALVTHSPDWMQMNPDSMNQWWGDVMQERRWHATPDWQLNPVE